MALEPELSVYAFWRQEKELTQQAPNIRVHRASKDLLEIDPLSQTTSDSYLPAPPLSNQGR